MEHPKPDPGFMRKLKLMDNRLDCEFRPTVKDGRFVITYKTAVGPTYNVMAIETENGEFRFPDERDLWTLKKGDMEGQTMREKLNKSVHYMRETRLKHRKQTRSLIKEQTVDNKIQLARAMARPLNPKAFSGTFRKIQPKITNLDGFTVIDRRFSAVETERTSHNEQDHIQPD